MIKYKYVKPNFNVIGKITGFVYLHGDPISSPLKLFICDIYGEFSCYKKYRFQHSEYFTKYTKLLKMAADKHVNEHFLINLRDKIYADLSGYISDNTDLVNAVQKIYRLICRYIDDNFMTQDTVLC